MNKKAKTKRVKNMIRAIIADAEEALAALNSGDNEKADLALCNVTADADFALSLLAHSR